MLPGESPKLKPLVQRMAGGALLCYSCGLSVEEHDAAFTQPAPLQRPHFAAMLCLLGGYGWVRSVTAALKMCMYICLK